MKKTKRNGAGLAASQLTGNNGGTAAPAQAGEYRLVRRELVRPDPNQPRKVFDEGKLRELRTSIAAHGIAQPLVVQEVKGLTIKSPDLVETQWQAIDGKGAVVFSGEEDAVKNFAEGKTESYYQIIFGERRWRAAGGGLIEDSLGRQSEWPGLQEVPVIVRSITERDVFALQFIENHQRENLSALEEAQSFKEQIEKRKVTEPDFSAEKLAEELRVARGTVYNRLALTRLSEPVREALVAGKISTSVAGLVAMVPTPKLQKKLLDTLTNESDYRFPFSFRDVQVLIDEDFCTQLKDASFDLEDEHLESPQWLVRDTVNGAEIVLNTNKAPTVPAVRMAFTAQDLSTLDGKPKHSVFAGGRNAPQGNECILNSVSKSEAVGFVAIIEGGRPVSVERLGGGKCSECPLRTGNMMNEFPELKNPNVCTQPACFKRKEEAHKLRIVEKARQEGKVVLDPKESQRMFHTWAPEKPAYGSGYTLLKEVCDADPKKRTYQQLLGSKAPAPISALNPEGKLLEVWDKNEIMTRLAEKGLKFAQEKKEQLEMDPAKAKEQEEEKQRSIERREKMIDGLLVKAMAAVEKMPTDAKTEAQFWRWFIVRLDEFCYSFGGIARRRGLKANKLETACEKMGLQELRSLAMEVVVCDQYGDGIVQYDGDWSESFKSMCEFAGVDLKAEEKAHQEPQLIAEASAGTKKAGKKKAKK